MNKAAPDQEHIVTGILFRIGMGLSFSTMGAMLKLASTRGLNAPELVFYRSLFSLPVVLFWVLRRESLASSCASIGRPCHPFAYAEIV